MPKLSPLLRTGLALAFRPGRIVENVADAAKRVAILSVCAIVAGLIMLPAAGCLAAALWIFVEDRLGSLWAALITAAALVLLAVIILGIGLAQRKTPRKRHESRQKASPAQTALAAWPAAAGAALASLPPPEAVGAAGKTFFRNHKGTMLLAAAVAGLVFGQDLTKPRRRK